jgi:uncharacterized membrane protein
MDREYLFSVDATGYWLSIAATLAAALSFFLIPDNLYPFVYIRYGLGLLLTFFLPGYALAKILFPIKAPISNGNKDLDNIELVGLGIGLSFILTSVSGLVLQSLLHEVNSVAATLLLVALSIVLCTGAIERKMRVDKEEQAVAFVVAGSEIN